MFAKTYDSKYKRQTFLFCQHLCKQKLIFSNETTEKRSIFSGYTNRHLWNQGEAFTSRPPWKTTSPTENISLEYTLPKNTPFEFIPIRIYP